METSNLSSSLLRDGALSGLLFCALACGSDTAERDALATVPAEARANVFTASAQAHAALALRADGSVVTTWDSRRQERGGYGVYARAFDALGRALTHEVHVNRRLPGLQSHPAVACLDDGDAWIAWECSAQDGSGTAVVARRLSADLRPYGDEQGVNRTTAGDQGNPAVAALGDRALAVWSSDLESGTARPARGIRARVLGDPDAPEIAISAPQASDDTLPAVAARGDAGFVVTWSRAAHAGGDARVWARLLDHDGTPCGDAFRVAVGDADEVEPSVDGRGDGGFVVAWHAARKSGWAAMTRAFDADGRADGPAREVARPEAGWISGVTVAADDAGGAWIGYTRDRGGDAGTDVVGRRLERDGRLGEERAVTAHRAGRQALSEGSGARRSAWGAGGVLAHVWEGDGGTGDSSAVHLSVRAPAGLRVPPPPPLGPARVAEAPADEDYLAAIPPLWNPQVVQPERRTSYPAVGGDFGFEGVPNTSWTPPDPEIAVGPAHIVVVTNGEIATFDKQGTPLWSDELENSFGFWGSVGATNFVFDPEVIWDPHAQRFIAMANERSATNTSEFLLAVSKDATPQSAGDWWKYRINVTALAGNDIDSPNVGVNEDHILLTADFFFPDTHLVFVVDKASVLGGGTPVTTHELITGRQSFGVPVSYDAGTPLFMLESTELSSNSTVILHAITNPFTGYSRTTFTLGVPTYTFPNQPPQKGTASRPFLFEPRFWSVAQRNGSLWAVHHVDSSRARVRWYEIDLNGWPAGAGSPSLAHWGEIDPGAGIHTYFPSIHVDDAGNVAVTYARSAANEYISIGRSTRAAGDPPGTLRPSQVVQVSTNAHTSGRWGDYSGTQADPSMPGSFWGHHEFNTGSTASWRTWVARYDLRPAPLLLDLPATVSAGQTLTASVTGAQPGGQVFLAYSTTGTGLTTFSGQDLTLGLEAPQLARVLTAGAGGGAAASLLVPASFAGRTVWVQAAEVGHASQVERRVVQ